MWLIHSSILYIETVFTKVSAGVRIIFMVINCRLADFVEDVLILVEVFVANAKEVILRPVFAQNLSQNIGSSLLTNFLIESFIVF